MDYGLFDALKDLFGRRGAKIEVISFTADGICADIMFKGKRRRIFVTA